MAKKPDKLQTVVKRLHEINTEASALNASLKALERERVALEQEFMELRNEQTRVDYDFGGAQVTSSIVPTVEDWDKVYAFIAKKKAFFLLERRMTVTAYREYLEQGTVVPGTKPFEKYSVKLVKK